MEREEVNDLITAKTSAPLARIESSVDLIAVKIGYIEEHMKIANGNTAKNVLAIEEVRKKVEELESEIPHTKVNCPQNGTLDELKKFVDEARNKKKLREEFGEAYLKTKGEKRAEFLKMVTTVSVIIAALALLINLSFSVIGYYQRKDIKTEVISQSKE